MKTVTLAFAVLALAIPALAAAQGSPTPAASPVGSFLHAADANDFAAMQAVMDPGSVGFLKLVGHCYLRAVYSNQETHELVAAWMCAEGANRSRVVLGTVALTSANKVSVSVRMNQVNDRPAPPRTGSAFGK